MRRQIFLTLVALALLVVGGVGGYLLAPKPPPSGVDLLSSTSNVGTVYHSPAPQFSPSDMRAVACPTTLSGWESLAITHGPDAVRLFCLLPDVTSAQSRRILDIIVGSSNSSPEDLWEACSSSGNLMANNMIAGMLAVRWLKEDPIRFLELLPKIPIETRDMIGGSFAEGVASGSPEQIGELFAKYEPLIGITGRGEFASNLVRQLVERTPANWQESVSQLIPKFSTNETRSFAAQAAFRLAVNPIALALSLETTGGLTSHTMPTFENELEKRVLADPSFVGEWLNTCPKGEVRDHAASVYAKAINLVNPAAAAAWARQIDNLTLQQAILLELGSAKGH